jgi:hypothetical protein
MAKGNRAAKQDWHDEQRRERQVSENLDRDMERLRYAGCKRHDMPDPEVFAAAGMNGVALKIRQAIALLEDAYTEARTHRRYDD